MIILQRFSGVIFALSLLTSLHPKMLYATEYRNAGKLLATSGITQIEGSAGGGLVPWAVIAGYGSKEQVTAVVSQTQVSLKDYRLEVTSAAVGLYDKVELSYAKQRFSLQTLGGEIKQDVFGAKVKLYGDVVYGDWPQISLGAHHKVLQDEAVANLVGAKSTSNTTDFYLAATKVHLGLVGGYNMVWNVTGRFTDGNELGLLGYGSSTASSPKLMLEGSLGVLLSEELAVGVEYRQKPDNLGLKEEHWQDVFIAYLPNKHFSITLAWAQLGAIAGADGQEGLFLNMTGKLW